MTKSRKDLPLLQPLAARVALLSTGRSVDAAAREIGCNPRMLWAAIRGEDGASQRVFDGLRKLLGEERWAYATGKGTRLPQPEQRAA